MSVRRRGLLLLLAASVGCGSSGFDGLSPADSTLLHDRATRLAVALDTTTAASMDAPIARWLLPASLAELSGMALTRDGRLLVHGDERGQVSEIDFRTGRVVKTFSVGSPTVLADFEGITVVGDTIILLTSRGVLYAFAEGADGDVVTPSIRKTGLTDTCREFEGLIHEVATRSLLLVCKQARAEGLREMVVLYRLPLNASAGDSVAAQVVTAAVEIDGAEGGAGFHAADGTSDPLTGRFLLVAAQEKALLEVTATGTIHFARPLPAGHEQPESLALTTDGILIIGDEAGKGPATITLYRWR